MTTCKSIAIALLLATPALADGPAPARLEPPVLVAECAWWTFRCNEDRGPRPSCSNGRPEAMAANSCNEPARDYPQPEPTVTTFREEPRETPEEIVK